MESFAVDTLSVFSAPSRTASKGVPALAPTPPQEQVSPSMPPSPPGTAGGAAGRGGGGILSPRGHGRVAPHVV